MAHGFAFPGSACVLPINFSSGHGGRDETSVYIIPDSFEEIMNLIKNPKEFLLRIQRDYFPPNPNDNPVWEVDDQVAILFRKIEPELIVSFRNLVNTANESTGFIEDEKLFESIAVIHFEIKSMSIIVHYQYTRNTPGNPEMTHQVQPVNVTKALGTTFAMTHFDIELITKDQVENAEVKAQLVYDMITNGNCLNEYYSRSVGRAVYSEGIPNRLGTPPIGSVNSHPFDPNLIIIENPTILVERANACPTAGTPAPPVCDTMISTISGDDVTVVSAVIQDYAVIGP